MMTLNRAVVAIQPSHAQAVPAFQERTPAALGRERKSTMKPMVALLVSAVLWPLLMPALVEAQPQFPPTIPVQFGTFKTSDEPQALVLMVHGRCDFSEDGTLFKRLKAGNVLKQDAVIRTSEGARTDLFFRRIGTVVRLQADTEIRLEKMTRQMTRGKPVMQTWLHLKTGRIFTVVRSLVPGSTFVIRNAAGRSVVEGAGGKGRYIITADGTQVADRESAVPLKVIGQTGITVIRRGQQFDWKQGKVFALAPSDGVKALIEFDELDSLAEQLSAPAPWAEGD